MKKGGENIYMSKYTIDDFSISKKKKKKKKKYQKCKFTVQNTAFDDIIDGIDLSVTSDVDISVNDKTVSKLINIILYPYYYFF